MVPPGKERHAQAEALLNALKAEHPVLKHCLPLADDVESELLAAHRKPETWLLKLALHLHLNSPGYLQSLAHGGPRHRLDGSPSGEVSIEDRHHARALLRHQRAHRRE